MEGLGENQPIWWSIIHVPGARLAHFFVLGVVWLSGIVCLVILFLSLLLLGELRGLLDYWLSDPKSPRKCCPSRSKVAGMTLDFEHRSNKLKYAGNGVKKSALFEHDETSSIFWQPHFTTKIGVPSFEDQTGYILRLSPLDSSDPWISEQTLLWLSSS